MKTFFREIVLTVIMAVVIFLVLQSTVQSFIVVGASMEPNFDSGERLIVTKVSYRFHEPERGNVIVFHPPNNGRADYIKRIIALPGETVQVNNGAVYINGEPLDEPFIKDPPKYNFPKQKVPDNKYFVLGDNRNNSNDSHNGWTVPRANIIGKAWLSIWPPPEWGVVPSYASNID